MNKYLRTKYELEAVYSLAQMHEDPKISLMHQYSENNEPAEAAIRMLRSAEMGWVGSIWLFPEVYIIGLEEIYKEG